MNAADDGKKFPAEGSPGRSRKGLGQLRLEAWSTTVLVCGPPVCRSVRRGEFAIENIFKHSLHKCEENEKFLTRFYEHFLAASPRVAEKFSDTDFKRQTEALRLSLRMMAMASVEGDAADLYLEYIARRHDRHHLNIEPELYELWLEALIDAVRECDDEFDAEVEQAWRSVLRYGIDYMIDHY